MEFDFAATVSVETIKSQVPVTYALHLTGAVPEVFKGNDILYRSPFRPDNNPSFACYNDPKYGEIVNRWRDMARSEGGDLFDLIGRLFDAPKFIDQYEHARRLYERWLGEAEWVPPEPVGSRSTFDVEAARAEMQALQLSGGHVDPIREWLYDREDQVRHLPAEWLIETFKLAWSDGALRIPYYDRDGEYVIEKYRRPGEKPMSVAGGTYLHLYGEWLDTDPEVPVVLCEGETDVWSGTHAVENVRFLGLPTGAGTSPERLLPRLVGRRVLIALDGDSAGRGAALRWARGLAATNEVEIVPMPEGRDLSDISDISGLLAQARPYVPPMDGILEIEGRYRSVTKDGSPGRQLSDFTLTPVRVMHSSEGGLSYEVRLGRRELLLQEADLRNKARFRDWAHRHGFNWAGSDTDTVALSSRLAVESLFVPSEQATDFAGLHEGHFVWDGGSIGDRRIRRVPSVPHVNLDVRLDVGPVIGDQVLALREINDHKVTDPILAWAAVAPLRSLLPQFPILNVAGTSGSGKTTTIRTLVPALTGSHIFQTLTSSTPWGVEAVVHNTNAFPVVFDEYRPGGRTQTLERLEQLARDAYDGQPSIKSAGGDTWNQAQHIRTLAPLVIAGEQSITETSHAERFVIVQVRRNDNRPSSQTEALAAARAYAQMGTGLARAFLEYLVWDLAEFGTTMHHPPTGPDHLPDRVRYNLGILDLGWRVLNQFLTRNNLDPLDDPDWSGVIEAVGEAASINPTMEALAWALGDEQAGRNVWIDGEEICVQVAGFVSDVRRAGIVTLPGNNAKTIKDQLTSDYNAYEARRQRDSFGQRKRVMVLPLSALDGDVA